MTFKKIIILTQYYYHLHLYQQHVAETAKTDSNKNYKQLQHKLQLHEQRQGKSNAPLKMVLKNQYRVTSVDGTQNFTITVEGGKITKSDYNA